MNKRLEAAKRFVDGMQDDTMRDRWIVDEEWVRHLRSDGKDIKVYDMNAGLSPRCNWCNERCVLDGYTLLHNEKYIHWQKQDPKKKTKMQFYYVLSEGKQAPTIPTDQSFYQNLWENREKPKRPLKRTAQDSKKDRDPQPSKKKVRRSEPPTPISLESCSPSTAQSSPFSGTFDCAFHMLEVAWKEKYPTINFPSNQVCFLPMNKSPLAASHPTPARVVHQQQDDTLHEERATMPSTGVRDIPLRYGRTVYNVPIGYDLIFRNNLSRFQKERAIVNALKKVMGFKQNQPTNHTRHLLGAFAASHPQISTMYQEQIIALARISLLLEVKAVVENDYSGPGIDFRWLTMENVANSSPSSSALTNWVIDLARDQYMIFSHKMLGARLFCQSDGGQKGQEVRLFTIFDSKDKSESPDGTICQFWADVAFAGKKSDQVAEAVEHSMQKFALPTKQLSGLTADSGSGTPESFANSCRKRKIWGERATEDSCGLHDLQSVFRLALQQYVGEGGLEARNAIQLVHTIYAFYKELKGRWTRAVKALWKRMHGNEDMPDDFAKDLLKAMQEPLTTRWWTIAVLACKARKYLPFFIKMAKGVRNMTTTKEKENTIASNLLSLASSDWIVADVFLIASLSQLFLNKHMKWYQGADPNIGRPGFLSFHRAVRYFLQLEDLLDAERSWETHELFAEFRTQVAKITNEKLRKMKQDSVRTIIHKMILQVRKHNTRYLRTAKLIRGVFADQATGQAIAQLLSREENLPAIATQSFFSKVHDREIDVVKFSKFLKDELSEETLQKLQADPLTIFHRRTINVLATETIDIWDRTSINNEIAHLLRKEALKEHAAHCSTQHNNERLVKLGALMASTGKSEIMAGVFAVASNDFMTEFHDGDEEQTVDDTGDAEQTRDLTEDEPTRRKRGNYRGKKKLFDFHRIVKTKEAELAAVAQELGANEYLKRQNEITEALLSKTSNLKEKDETKQVTKMMKSYDKQKTPNALEKITGEDIPPRLLGYFPYKAMGMKTNQPELKKELDFRNLHYDNKQRVRSLQGLLKEAEESRLKEELASDLRDRGLPSEGMQISAMIVLLKHDYADKSESTGGKYSIDFTKFFLKLCPDLDETIFEEQ
jgi:hypothetical protein